MLKALDMARESSSMSMELTTMVTSQMVKEMATGSKDTRTGPSMLDSGGTM